MTKTTKDAIADAMLAVQDEVRTHGADAAARKNWRRATPLAPRTVPQAELDVYREVFVHTASLASSLVASK